MVLYLWNNRKDIKEIKRFRLVLNSRGKAIYLGGNIEVMKPNLLKEFDSLRAIDTHFYKIGTTQEYFYTIEGYFRSKWEQIARY